MISLAATILVLCSCLSLANAGYVWTQEDVIGDAPKPRYHHAVALTNNHTVVQFGGFDFDNNGEYLGDTWAFDIVKKSWKVVDVNTTVSDPPFERAYATANTYKSELILYGGNTNVGNVLGDLWRFSHTYNSWTRDIFAQIPSSISVLIPRQYHASAVIGHILYTFGGQAKAFGRTTNSLLAYDLNTTVWSVLAADKAPGAPPARQAHSLTPYHDPFLGPSLLVFGGYSTLPYNGGFNDIWQFVLNKQAWLQLSPTNAPPIRYSHEAFMINQTLYIYGGLGTFNITTPPTTDVYYDDVWALKLYGNWTQVMEDSEPGMRQGHAAVMSADVLYTFGGYVPYVGLADDVWSFQVTSDNTTKTNV